MKSWKSSRKEILSVLTPFEIQEKLDQILLRVQKPGRYVGGELNQVVKDWDAIPNRIALVFPDIYDIGLPNLGLAILYESLNNRSDTLAERAYIPWVDMENLMRQNKIPLFSLETKHPLMDFDIIGISLPYETLYTNALNLLDLAGIPLHSKNRTGEHPLIIAGGHSVTNPEPMSPFIDAFVIGEGEEVIHEVVDAVHHHKKDTRQVLLEVLAGIKGIYVPTLYQPEYKEDGTIAHFHKVSDKSPLPVLKRILGKLPPPPTKFIVPSISVVHNRISIEVMRGCTRGCRFCHAGMITRPVRERPVSEIVQSIKSALKNTGFEEIALLSLSSSDYSQILELIETLNREFKGQHVTISLPSLRIETFSVDLLEKLKGARQGGFTLAPEAATERMRNIINKPISSEQLIDVASAIYNRGWLTLKLYFMIGHPSETLDDVKAIADLCKKVLAQGRKAVGGRASLHAGISTFVPKPHTPFQWVPCDTLEQIKAKQDLLQKELRGPGIKFNWTDPQETMLEAWLSRGDRRMGDVIFQAWKNGAKFDAWQDQFNLSAWQSAFITANLDPNFYTHRVRERDEVFPWDHINLGVRKSYLYQDYQMSLTGQLRPDCRQHCHACGILPEFNDLRLSYPGDEWKCPEVTPSSQS
jgi:radical SAM family uncharacterized protein